MSLINPQPPTEGAEILNADDEGSLREDSWLRLARQAYEDSSEWIDANLRGQWEKTLMILTKQRQL